MIITTLRQASKLLGLLLVGAIVTLATAPTVNVLAAPNDPEIPASEEDLKSYINDTAWYDPTIAACVKHRVAAVDADQIQANNAKIIIGIAKTYDLGRKGALIGLMTSLQESNLRNHANDGSWPGGEYADTGLKEISMSFPHEDVGNDHDSVGIMQQRPTTGWSTFGSGINREVIGQLMNPAYAAQAFFGTPPGAKLPDGLTHPGALKKGLQNVENWENLAPGVAAQKVQVSAFPDAYAKQQDKAQWFLDQYWESAGAIPLPVPIDGAATSFSRNSLCIGAGGVSSVLAKIEEYAWPDYCKRNSSSCPGYDKPITKRAPAEGNSPSTRYAAAVERTRKAGGYTGWGCYGGGVDCGAFVTIVMRDSGADPNYNSGPTGNTTQQLAYLRRSSGAGGKYTKLNPATKNDLKGGDIAIRETGQFGGRAGHTFFYVGGELGDDFHGESASASACERAGMASPTDDIDMYEWYRMNY
ncbi:MAG TPA: hypothetical protein VFB59_04700 [Candidatus Saccharimonadales bacterium]|nr:hypothetical protein [Candidatus Saccharimonadales bacterium]